MLAKLNTFNDLQFDWYNLEFLNNLYKAQFIQDNKKKSSININEIKDNEKKEIMSDKKIAVKKKNYSINKKRNTRNEIRISLNTELSKDFKNLIHPNSFRQNKSSSKVPNHTMNFEKKNKNKIPYDKVNFGFEKNNANNENNYEIKKVKTFLEGKNYGRNKLNELLNNKDNVKIKFMKSKDNIPHILKINNK